MPKRKPILAARENFLYAAANATLRTDPHLAYLTSLDLADLAVFEGNVQRLLDALWQAIDAYRVAHPTATSHVYLAAADHLALHYRSALLVADVVQTTEP